MKILEQFENKLSIDPIEGLAILKEMCSEHTTRARSCEICLANFGPEHPARCSLRRQKPNMEALCSVPENWYIPRNTRTKYSDRSVKSIRSIIAWFRDLMIYHPDRFKELKEYIDKRGIYK